MGIVLSHHTVNFIILVYLESNLVGLQHDLATLQYRSRRKADKV